MPEITISAGCAELGDALTLRAPVAWHDRIRVVEATGRTVFGAEYHGVVLAMLDSMSYAAEYGNLRFAEEMLTAAESIAAREI